MLLLALYQFKNRREKSVVEVVPYEMPRNYFATQKSNGLKTMLSFSSLPLISAVFSLAISSIWQFPTFIFDNCDMVLFLALAPVRAI